MVMTCSCIGIPACSSQVCQGTGGAGSWGASGTLGSSALSRLAQLLCVVVSPDNHSPAFPSLAHPGEKLPSSSSGSTRGFGDLDSQGFYLTSFCEVGDTLSGFSLLSWARCEFSSLQGKETSWASPSPCPRDANPRFPGVGRGGTALLVCWCSVTMQWLVADMFCTGVYTSILYIAIHIYIYFFGRWIQHSPILLCTYRRVWSPQLYPSPCLTCRHPITSCTPPVLLIISATRAEVHLGHLPTFRPAASLQPPRPWDRRGISPIVGPDVALPSRGLASLLACHCCYRGLGKGEGTKTSAGTEVGKLCELFKIKAKTPAC